MTSEEIDHVLAKVRDEADRAIERTHAEAEVILARVQVLIEETRRARSEVDAVLGAVSSTALTHRTCPHCGKDL